VVPPTQRARWIARTLLLALPLTLLAGCSDDDGGGEPADFTVDITHEFWPMRPGTRWTYRESTEDEELTVVVTVTGVTKRIANGVTARVVRDTVTQGDQVVEDTFDWYAQDADGNVWYLGENTAEFEDGKLAPARAPSRQASTARRRGSSSPPTPGPAWPTDYEGEAEDSGACSSSARRRASRQASTPTCSSPRTPTHWSPTSSSTSTTRPASAQHHRGFGD
jgi:hypothetical protein